MIQLKYILNFSYHAWEINEWLYMNFISILKDNISSQLFLRHFKISWGFLVFYWVKSRGLCVSLTQASEQQEMVCDSLCFYFPASSQVMNSSIHSQFRSSSPWNHSWSSRSAPSGESLAWTTFLGTAVTWLTSIHIIRMWYMCWILWCMTSPADMQAEISSHCARLSFSRVGMSHHFTRWLDHLVPLPRLQEQKTLKTSVLKHGLFSPNCISRTESGGNF